MTDEASPSKSPGAEAEDESGGSNVESWLRKAARVPNGDSRTLLPQPGQVIGGKYRIEEQLGKGGMGAVYRATHVVSDKQVALKWMLRPASDERAKERFTREARAAGRIDHPNVVDVYDIGQQGDAGYLVMELLHGETLRQRLAKGPLSVAAVVDLLLPAMRGVAAVHREGVIHRDLKPDNIFLCRAPTGVEREAKVLDFGISIISTSEADRKTTFTKEGMVLGTPSYMSPEQLESVRSADARTDVYAFGVILYEALTGSLPFTGDSYSALVLAITNNRVRSPRELRPEIPAELERVVLQAIEKDRDLRLNTMDALIAELLPFASVKSARSGEQVSIEPQRATVAGTRRSARSRAIALSLLVVLVSVLAWWALRDRARFAAGGVAVSPQSPARAQANATFAAPASVAPAPADPAQPDVPASVRGTTHPAEPQAPLPQPGRAAETKPASSASEHPRLAASAPQPAPKQAAAPSTPTRARSGSISLDDL